MPRGRILLADNHGDFLESCADSLKAAGYTVLTADSPASAQRLLTEEWVHLAVLDLRLDDDTDERDKSGLVLARMVAPSVPKIILTAYPSIEDVRGALLPTADGSASAVDFVKKVVTMKPLLEAVERAFALHVRIDQDLTFEFGELGHGAFLALADAIEGDAGDELLLGRASEIEDLFRRLFRGYEHVKLDRLLWRHGRRSALTAFAFAGGKPPESLAVVCGPRVRQVEELRRYKEFAPKTPSETGTFLTLSADTTHFAANAYKLAGADLESVVPVSELYRGGPEKSFNASLVTLFKKVLASWHEGGQGSTSERTLAEAYRERAGAALNTLSPRSFRERVAALARLTPAVGLDIIADADEFTLSIDGRAFSYPDPTIMLFDDLSPEHRFVLVNSPGVITCSNVLADAGGHAWLTDFEDAGLAPQLWHHVSLEAAFRFDMIDARRLQWIQHLETSLVEGEFGRLYVADLERSTRQIGKAIQSIRKVVPRAVHRNPNHYHLGVLFQAAARFAEFTPGLRPTPRVLLRIVHLLLAMLTIGARLSRAQSTSQAVTQPSVGIRLDESERAVWINGTRVRLGRQSYDLLHEFYKHPNQLRTRSELFARIFNEEYDETDTSHVSRLNTAIHRLRNLLEEDPNQPRHLLTAEGGYRLIVNPD